MLAGMKGTPRARKQEVEKAAIAFHWDRSVDALVTPALPLPLSEPKSRERRRLSH